jgi:hypothetical protein
MQLLQQQAMFLQKFKLLGMLLLQQHCSAYSVSEVTQVPISQSTMKVD